MNGSERFPKPCVAGSIPARGAGKDLVGGLPSFSIVENSAFWVAECPGLLRSDGMLDEFYAARLKSGGVGGQPWSIMAVQHALAQLGELLKWRGAGTRHVPRRVPRRRSALGHTRDCAADTTVWAPDELRSFLEFRRRLPSRPDVARRCGDGHAPRASRLHSDGTQSTSLGRR